MKKALDNPKLGIKVIDVREADEYEIAKVDGVPLLPLSQIKSRFSASHPKSFHSFRDGELSLLFHTVSFGADGSYCDNYRHDHRSRDEPRPYITRFVFGRVIRVFHSYPDYLRRTTKAQPQNHRFRA